MRLPPSFLPALLLSAPMAQTEDYVAFTPKALVVKLEHNRAKKYLTAKYTEFTQNASQWALLTVLCPYCDYSHQHFVKKSREDENGTTYYKVARTYPAPCDDRVKYDTVFDKNFTEIKGL